MTRRPPRDPVRAGPGVRRVEEKSPGPDGGASPTVVLVVMCAGYFLVLLDVTIVNVALPRLTAGLGAGGSAPQWVVDAYAVVLAGGMLAAGTVGDRYGHRRVVLTGLAVFGLASLGCGLAPNPAALIALRAVQGAGAALLPPGTLAVITHAFPCRTERARAIGIWAGIGGAALPAGPPLGGLLVEAAGRRAVFLQNVPIVAVAFAAARRVVRDSGAPRGPRLDRAGLVLGAAALVAVTYAFIAAGHAGTTGTVAAAGAAAVAVVAFVAVERRREHPMLPWSSSGGRCSPRPTPWRG